MYLDFSWKKKKDSSEQNHHMTFYKDAGGVQQVVYGFLSISLQEEIFCKGILW